MWLCEEEECVIKGDLKGIKWVEERVEKMEDNANNRNINEWSGCIN